MQSTVRIVFIDETFVIFPSDANGCEGRKVILHKQIINIYPLSYITQHLHQIYYRYTVKKLKHSKSTD